MPAARAHPLLELTRWIAGNLAFYRLRRAYAPLGREEVTADIAADCVAHTRALSATAHSAEVHAREALALSRAAQDPASPGGPAITPAEAAPILRLLARTADTTHDLAESTTLPAAAAE